MVRKMCCMARQNHENGVLHSPNTLLRVNQAFQVVLPRERWLPNRHTPKSECNGLSVLSEKVICRDQVSHDYFVRPSDSESGQMRTLLGLLWHLTLTP